ncbi:FmdE family protein [Methanothrix soehngenii]|jgi:formylmethanofuran dehydrogenase subunit E|uniref:FmdE family protein n=1 Tax=Methanothrix soehngenii TaxID=2223 RepID=UPI0023F1B67E|nr:FmdE family protein [Methanothrix soehngenii]MCK9587011.1 FmdE family protein [Methanothrix soehngenii]MDD5257043.1 FmdE family protein [Methanothrix soehngenii]MDD5735546.1 FmdE family protein [Methanothrix soehngenii]
MDDDFKEAAEFHGHTCPGLAIGYRIAKYVKEHYPRSQDEELVCIAENKSCSIDAIQFMLGCTAGKGNLLFKDYGKQAFTFYSRDKNKALRIYFRGGILKGMDELRQKMVLGELGPEDRERMAAFRSQATEKVLSARDEDILTVEEVDIPAPEKARIHPSLKCEECGEEFMEILGRTAGGKVLCKGCFERLVC